MKPLFDFNDDGGMDLLEFLSGAGAFDPNSPMNQDNGEKREYDNDGRWDDSDDDSDAGDWNEE